LEEIIDEHLREGKYKSIVTRFPPEPNGYLHIGAWLTKDPVVKKRMLTDFDHLDISNLSELIDSIRSFEKSQEIDKYTVSY
jgi:hypothetical protein